MAITDFTKGTEWRQIFIFAIPMLLGNLFLQFYQLVDTVIVGQTIGKEALAAVGSVASVNFLMVSLVTGISMGASVVISQYFGAKKFDRINLASDTLMICMLLLSAGVLLVGLFFSRTILVIMNLPAEIIEPATQYLRIFMCGSVMMFGYNSVAAVLRGVGDSRTPLYFLILASILNVGLDFLFILAFHMGVAGAAWATVAAQGVAFIASIVYVNRTNPLLKINLLRLKFDREIFGQCIRLGLPSGIQQAFVGLGMMALIGIVSQFGTDTVAAYATVTRIDSLVALPVMNFSAALTSFVGQNTGAGEHRRIHRGLVGTIGMTLLTCLILNSLIIFFGPLVMQAFTSDPNVIAIGSKCLTIINAFYFCFGMMMIFNGLLRGLGAMVFPMFITLLTLWGIRIPIASFFGLHFGVEGIWWAIPLSWFISFIASVAYYYSGRWRGKAVVQIIHDN